MNEIAGFPSSEGENSKDTPIAASPARTFLCRILASADIMPGGRRPWDIQIHDERFFSRVIAEGTLGLGESYMDGWWDCEALDEMFFRALRARLDGQISSNWKMLVALAPAIILNRQSRRRARRVGEWHYDLGNDFFEAMLDPAMQYSCAYFRENESLADAQEAKLDLICRKLDLKRGMRLLDIGCGWGGLAKHVALRHGCEVVGITISRQQQAYAAAACQGLPVEIRLQDYRDVSGSFDRVASVGMLEHVGCKNYRAYMEIVWRHLRPNGLFLCQAIGLEQSSRVTDPWIARYIFPNSMLPSASQVIREAEGLFILEDLHNFGADYDRTLLAWEKNFTEAWDRFSARYGDRFRRMWRYYLLSCAGAFRARSLQVFQFLFSKGGIEGGCVPVR